MNDTPEKNSNTSAISASNPEAVNNGSGAQTTTDNSQLDIERVLDEKESKKNKHSTKNLFIKTSIVGIIDLIVFFLLIFYIRQTPLVVEEIKKENKEHLSTNQEAIAELDSQISSTKPKVDFVNSYFHDEVGIVGFASQIDALKKDGLATNFEFRSSDTIKDKTKATGLPFIVEFSGDEASLSQGLSRLQSLPYIKRAINVQINQLEDGRYILNYGGFLYVDEAL